ncbi:hypothetical protein BDK51DRAFT_24729, partial [Blyttiomyces helicus]
QISVKFRSRVCKSVLWTDIGETGIIFDDCVVGGTYFKDFTIWNRSEIDLYWVLNTVDLSNRQDNTWLKFSDYDTGEPLDGKLIPSYSPRRIRVTFRPREVGEFNYDLQVENGNDSANTVQALIHAVVRSVLREESLVVSSGNVLDFGDCCAGQWSKQRLVLRNVSEAPLDVAFATDNSAVVFQLKSDDLTQENVGGGTASAPQGQQQPPTPPFSHSTGAAPFAGADAGERLFERLKELSLAGSTSSEMSNPPSAPSSRASSPTGHRRDSDMASNTGSGDFLSFPGHGPHHHNTNSGSGGSPMRYDDEDSDDLENIPDRTVGEGVGTNGEEFRRIEELLLRPGTERTVEVCYRPEKDADTPDHRAGRLSRRAFRIVLTYAHQGHTTDREKKNIQCKARVCTSFIDVAPREVHFGDTDVGTLKSAPVQITNCSDLPARIELRFVSKVLNCFRGEIVIPAKQTVEAKIDIYPRKVNPDYRKQITVVNLLNRDSDRTVEVRSTNIDKNRVTFHSLFYRILTPTSTNFIDFGAVVIHSPAVRTFTIDNISRKTLELDLTSSMPDEIKIYAKGAALPAPRLAASDAAAIQRREKLLETIGDRRSIKRGSALLEGASGEREGASAAGIGAGGRIGVVIAGAGASGAGAGGGSGGGSANIGAVPDYLDLASPASDGRRSPRRRGVVSTPHQGGLKHLRMQIRERRGLGHVGGADDSPLLSSTATPMSGDESGSELVSTASDRLSTATQFPDLPLDPPHTAPPLASYPSPSSRLADMLESPSRASMSIDVLLPLIESATGSTPPIFPRPASEERYVKAQSLLRRELENVVRDGRLVPLERVTIPAEGQVVVVLVFTASGADKPYVQGRARKHDARIFLKLISFDREIQQPQFEQLLQASEDHIPVRELMLRSSLCRSVMDLGQKFINFGTVDKNEHRTKTIVIRNNSEAPLLYAIRKSGSIASGDLIIGDGRTGVVRGYGKREVEFVFDPSLAGPFHERLAIENVADRENDAVLSVKALIRRPASFFLQSLFMDFGVCLVNEVCPVARNIVVSNTSFKQIRTFEVRCDPAELRFEGCVAEIDFHIVEDDGFYDEEGEDPAEGAASGEDADPPQTVRRRRRRPVMMLSKEMEEEIEHLEQKLKIAKRKGRADKVKKLVDKLERLRAGIVDDEYGGEQNETAAATGPDSGAAPEVPKPAPVSRELSTLSGVDGNDTPAPAPPAAGADEPWEETASARGSDVPVISALVPPASTPNVGRVKRTENSIIFSLEPRAIKTIAVFFRPRELSPREGVGVRESRNGSDVMSPLSRPGSVFDDSMSDTSTPPSTVARAFPSTTTMSFVSTPSIGTAPEPPLREVCMGHVFLNELKNTDVVKTVEFRAVVCYDHPTYLLALSEEADRKAVTVEGDDATSPATGDLPGRSRPLSPRPSFTGLRSSTGRPLPLMLPDPQAPAVVSPSTSVLGLVELGKGPGLGSSVGAVPLSESPAAASPATPVRPPQHLAVEMPHIDLGRLEIHERKECYFTLTNRGDVPLPYEIVLPSESQPAVGFPDPAGVLSIRETRRVDLSITPATTGRTTVTFAVCNLLTSLTVPVVFSFYTIAATYLRFPSLPDPNAASPELDLGNCYVDPAKKYARVVRLDAENVSDNDLVISVVSNLSQQCFIFADAALEGPVVDVPLAPSAGLSVWIALQPYLGGTSAPAALMGRREKSGSTAGDARAGSAGGGSGAEDCRTLIGGIRFLVQTREEASTPTPTTPDVPAQDAIAAAVETAPFLLTTQTVKFSALIGQSLFGISETLLDLGLTRSLGATFTCELRVWNLSSRLPLEYRIECPSGRLHVSRSEGRIDGAGAGADRIEVALNCVAWGHVNDYFHVVNVNNSAQKVPVEVRLFADVGAIALNSLLRGRVPVLGVGLGSGIALVEEDSVPGGEDGARLPQLAWDDVYVALAETSAGKGAPAAGPLVTLQKRNRSEAAPMYERSFEVENVTAEAIELVPKSQLDLGIRWAILGGAGTVLDRRAGADGGVGDDDRAGDDRSRVCGSGLLLLPRQRATVFVTVPKPGAGSDEELAMVLAGGKRASLKGLLLFEDARRAGLVVKAIDLVAAYCLSRGEVDPAAIDLGKVGHFNTWGDVRFGFTVRNLADIPLLYELQLPDAVDVLAFGGDQDQLGAAKRRVEPRGSQLVEAVLKPRQLDLTAPGPRSLSVGIVNVFNPRNTMSLSVVAQLTLVELRFERLVSGELVLPALTHPHLPAALPCDTWFTVVNTGDEDAKFEIGFVLAPDVSEFVRLEVLSRFSNSPLVGSVALSPHGSIEVKVRAYAREDSRLPANHPNARYLTNPAGVTFGTLWVTSKNQAAPAVLGSSTGGGLVNGTTEDRMRMTENIPLRGVIIEGQTFTLSERRVEFRCVMESDSEDEAPGTDLDEKLSSRPLRPPRLRTQRETIVITNLSRTFPLEFKLALAFPMEVPTDKDLFRVSPLDDDLCGSVEPGGRLSLVLELMDPKIGGFSEDAKILVHDRMSLSRTPQIIYVGIVEDTNGSLEIADGAAEVEEGEASEADTGAGGAYAGVGQEGVGEGKVVGEGAGSGRYTMGSTGDEDGEADEPSDAQSSSSFGAGDRLVQSFGGGRPSTVEALPHRRPPGHFALRGCKRVSISEGESGSGGGGDGGALYELDLGQQDLGATPLAKKLVLENTSVERVSYRVRSLSEVDRAWILPSRFEGTLEPPRSGGGGSGTSERGVDSHSITISFMAATRGVYSTYLIIENVDNPMDTKTVRVAMQVVARQNIRRSATGALVPTFPPGTTPPLTADPVTNHVFDVHVSGIDGGSESIDMGTVYFGAEYSARSMIIWNRESVPLDFTVKGSLSRDDDTELVFSLSRTSAKLFRSLTIEPEGQARVYLRLRALPDPLAPSPPRTLGEADRPIDKSIEIHINCKLVKDYQKTVMLRAACRRPQIGLSSDECSFVGTIRRRDSAAAAGGGSAGSGTSAGSDGAPPGVEDDLGWAVTFRSPTSAVVEITNLLLDPFECEIVNDSAYFNVEAVESAEPLAGDGDTGSSPVNAGRAGASSAVVIGADMTHRIRLVPNMEAVYRNAESLRREKYILEHVTVYNKRRPSEKRFIRLKLQFGFLSQFESASGSRRSHSILEGRIVRFLRDIEINPLILTFPLDDSLGEDTGTRLADRSADMYFKYVYIVDQLIHYGTREHAAENYMHLANLLFGTLFSSAIFKEHAALVVAETAGGGEVRRWPAVLARWISTFSHFVTFFPHRQLLVEPLRDLARFMLTTPPPVNGSVLLGD